MPFHHPDGRIIYALEYRLADGSSLNVWLDESGDDENRYTTNEDTTRHVVTTKPGECLIHCGQSAS